VDPCFARVSVHVVLLAAFKFLVGWHQIEALCGYCKDVGNFDSGLFQGAHLKRLDTYLTEFSARKIIFSPPARSAHDAICALRQRPIEVVVAVHATRQSAEVRPNSDLGPSTLHLTID
jgi:hypothetical protein